MSAQELHMPPLRAILLDVAEMPHDMKRMLRVQWKELIHTIEDSEYDSRLKKQKRPENQAA